jgi:type I restriction enzyme S subunit
VSRHPRYPAYKDSGVDWLGEIPVHWDFVKLKYALSCNDSGVWGEDYSEEGTIVLRSTDMTIDGHWDIQNPARRVLSTSEYSSARLQAGDLLITKSSGSALHLGKTALVTPEVEALDCCFSNFMQRLRTRNDFNSNYLHRILNSPIGREQFNFFGSTTTGLANLNQDVIDSLLIPTPPLAEQRAIAAFLDGETARIDGAVAEYRRLTALLQEKRAALISHAVTRGLDPDAPRKDSGIPWLGEIPAHWGVMPLKFACRQSALYGANISADEYTDDGIRFLRTTDIDDAGNLHSEDAVYVEPSLVEEYELEDGDLLLSRSGTIGRSFLYDVQKHGPCAYAGYLVGFKLKSSMLPKFAFHFTKSKQFEEWLSLSVISSTIGNVSGQKYANMPILVPSYHEQRAIAAYLDRETARLDGAIAEIEEAVAHLEAYRTALISAAVTGKIDVRA